MEKNKKKSHKNNKFKIPAPTWNEKFKLLDGSCSVSDIQYYFTYFIKKHETLTHNPPIKIYIKKIVNKITVRIKTMIIVNNDYQHHSRILYQFVPNKLFGCRKIFIFLKFFNSEFSYIEVWFPDPTFKPQEINIT